MNTVQAMASALGLGFLAGLRLYLTVLVTGIGIRLGWIHLPDALSQLSVLADGRILTVAAVASLAEFFADKVPWVDSAWDSVHTFVRPIGAAALGATAAWNLDPAIQWVVILLCGGLAFSGHSSKAATRLAVNHSPEPFSNIGMSLLGDVAVPAGVWLSFQHPGIMLGAIAVFLLVFAWLAPRIIRATKIEWLAFRSRFKRTRGRSESEPISASLNDNLRRVFAHLRDRDVDLPEQFAAAVQNKLGERPRFGWSAVAARGVKALRGSPGYLCITAGRLVFVTRRLFRVRVHSVELDAIREARLHRRLMMDGLEIDLGFRSEHFDLFKGSVSPAPATRQRRLATMD